MKMMRQLFVPGDPLIVLLILGFTVATNAHAALATYTANLNVKSATAPLDSVFPGPNPPYAGDPYIFPGFFYGTDVTLTYTVETDTPLTACTGTVACATSPISGQDAFTGAITALTLDVGDYTFTLTGAPEDNYIYRSHTDSTNSGNYDGVAFAIFAPITGPSIFDENPVSVYVINTRSYLGDPYPNDLGWNGLNAMYCGIAHWILHECRPTGVIAFSPSASVNIFTPAPLPHAVWLFTSGLLGLIGIARTKKAL